MNDPYFVGYLAGLAAIETIVAPLRDEFDRDGTLTTSDLVQHLVADWQRCRADSLRLTAVEHALSRPIAAAVA